MRVAYFLQMAGMMLACTFAETPSPELNASTKGDRFTVAALADRHVPNTPEIFIVSVGTNRFALSVPLGWSAFYDETARSVTLRRGETKLVIEFEGKRAAFTRDGWLENLRKMHSGLEVLNEPLLFSLSRQAVAFDLQWKHAGGFQVASRVARIVAGDVLLHFELVCTPEEFEGRVSTMMQVMATLRTTGSDGQVELPTFGVE